MPTPQQMIISAAAQSLGQSLPESWSDMERPEKLTWLTSNKSVSLGATDPEEFLQQIEARAQSLEQSMKEAFQVLREGLGNNTKDSADWLEIAGLI